ncbi:MAG TPA: hypothetical protein VGQ22_18335 [Steroidobacteraceae bacterium]|jgi:hypothetical protein|nr:hypothetical protein [Steroidobacteraceae bacterium]
MATHEQQVENAIADPTRRYASPMDVVHDDELDTDEKRRILESWKKDAELLSTAQDENMAGGERSQLQDVSLALSELEKLRA